jgi:hypothetical protein
LRWRSSAAHSHGQEQQVDHIPVELTDDRPHGVQIWERLQPLLEELRRKEEQTG